MPYSLQCIEFRRVGREIIDLYIFVMSRKPCPNIFVFVIGCIVLDQVYFLRAIASDYPFEIDNVRFGIEDLLKVIKEPCTI
jgi:hypothetical protein